MTLTKKKQCVGECPACGSGNLNFYDMNYYDDGIDHHFECMDCHKYGVEYYSIKYEFTEMRYEEEELKEGIINNLERD